MLDDMTKTLVEESQTSATGSTGMATRTTCPYCGVGCGVLASFDDNGARIVGDPDHPANFGRLCSKGSALGETLELKGRLLYPMERRSDGALARISWDRALERTAQRFKQIISEHGPDAVAVYLSGQLLTEDYYVANKLMKGFIGSANVDTNSRLCMASTVAGQKRAFGADTVPGCYEDLDVADLVVLVGSNAAWCHPILFQRIMRNKEERGARLIVIDTRRTATAEGADLFLQIAPGMDQALFAGLLIYLARTAAVDAAYIDRFTSGFDAAIRSAKELTPNIAATTALTGLREADVGRFFELFASTERVVTAFSQGVNQSAQGSDKVNAIINCHLATGRIGKPGASPLSLTGQPNAMGGREVGGLANSLAAHMGFDPASIDRVRRFWSAPSVVEHEGLKAVAMFEAIAQGKIKALWVVGTNPAASLPDADRARAAMRKLDFFVVSDNTRSNDTINSGAHLLLPAQAWGEKSGTVTNSERRISRQRAFLPSPGEARPDWSIFSAVARRMGYAGFDFRSAADVFREHAGLSAFENDDARDFDIGALAQLTDADYEELSPTQWPHRAGEAKGRLRFFGDGGFFTPDGRARFVSPKTPSMATQVSKPFPLRLNTGRIRDQWHTMTRTGASPRLGRHLPEPFVDINPADAAEFGVTHQGLARVSTRWGECVLRAHVTEAQPRGHIFAPIHWTDETARQARIGALVAPYVDPISGQPEAKATPAAIAPQAYAREGFLLARKPVAFPRGEWWTRVALAGAVGYRIASDRTDQEWLAFLAEESSTDDMVEFRDEQTRALRVARFDGDRPELFLSLGQTAQPWDASLAIFAENGLAGSQRRALLSGRSEATSDDGPEVCVCFGVGAKKIQAAIQEGCGTTNAIGERLRAGTNCGSCLTEIRSMILSQRRAGGEL